MGIRAWQVHDTGLVAVPGRFRRLPGRVRHHRGAGPGWPAEVELEVADDALRVTADGVELGRWALGTVTARPVSDGPPVQFVLEVDGSAHLLAAAGDADTAALLAALSA